jgi:anion-transporting  ArsA/GET3 family ATPase
MPRPPLDPRADRSSRGAASPAGEGLLHALEQRRFYFVTGKGGVGKTTVTAALALALAARGNRVLVALCNADERISPLLGSRPVGDTLSELCPGVWGVNLRPELALEEYGRMVLRVGRLADAVFDNQYVQAFFRATPGLHEWAMLGKAWWHTTELDGARPRFDVVLLDAPATGHGLDMLRVPKVILDVVPPGLLRQEAGKAWDMFCDPSQAGVLLVTLPEEMPTTETVELAKAVRELGLPIAATFVNGVLPRLFGSDERALLLADRDLLSIDAPLRRAHAGRLGLVAAARRAVRERIQAENERRTVEALRHLAPGAAVLTLPFLFERASTAAGTLALVERLGSVGSDGDFPTHTDGDLAS